MIEVTYNYSRKCLQIGKNRTVLLEKTLAAAIAYTSPIMAGSMSDINGHYRDLCKANAMRVISCVNEIMLINTHGVLNDVEKLWCGRYELINSPLGSNGVENFHNSLKQVGRDLTSEYEYWVPKFQSAVNTYIISIGGDA